MCYSQAIDNAPENAMSTDNLPAPLTAGHLCTDCNGTGADAAKTMAARKSGQADSRSYIRCWTCNGNGLDPAAYFRPCGATA